MAQIDLEATNPGRASLPSLERIGKGTAIANEIFSLVGRSLFFAEFSREDSIETSFTRTFEPRLGWSRMILAMSSRWSTANTVDSVATQVAKRGSPSIMDISPRVMPGPTLVMCCCPVRSPRLKMSTLPSMMRSMKSPPSFSRMRVSPA